MANSKDIQKVASEIAALSTRSPTEAGHPKSAPANPQLIDAINQIFALFQVNYHNQYYSAFGDNTKSENLAKRLWLAKLERFSASTICDAAEKIISESEYLPTLNKMLNACRHVAMPAGLVSARKAYQEACNKTTPKANQLWSHPVVYLAGRDTGWHMLAHETESKALPAFSDIYQHYIDRLLSGENFRIEKTALVPELSELPATKKHNQEKLEDLKKLLT
jgi:hypothetical protein